MTERDWYYLEKLRHTGKALERNGITAYVVNTPEDARKKVRALIKKGAVVGLGGSQTIAEIGLLDDLRKGTYTLLDQYDASLSKAESMEQRKKGTQAEYFISGTNAVTEDGKLVNIDGLGNRLAGFCFGPDRVIIVVGRNKVVSDIHAAIDRVRNVAAPMNAKRLGLSTPCVSTGRCSDCDSPQRICNLKLIIEKQRTKDRISVVLVNADLGF